MKNLLLRSVDASFLDARKRIRRKDRNPDRFKDVHNCVMYYSVGIVRQSEYEPFFGFVDSKSFVLRCLEIFTLQQFVKPENITFAVFVMYAHTIGPALSTPCLHVGQT